jgi:hypothetical protein
VGVISSVGVDKAIAVEVDTRLTLGVGVMAAHAVNNKNKASWDGFFIMRLYSFKQTGARPM